MLMFGWGEAGDSWPQPRPEEAAAFVATVAFAPVTGNDGVTLLLASDREDYFIFPANETTANEKLEV